MCNIPGRILAVDDHDCQLKLLTTILTKQFPNAVIDGVTSAHAALQLIKDHNYDILVTDIRMPDVDGVQLFEIVRNLSPHTIVIFVTADAYSRPIDHDGAALPFLLKPYRRRDIYSRVKLGLQMAEIYHIHSEPRCVYPG